MRFYSEIKMSPRSHLVAIGAMMLLLLSACSDYGERDNPFDPGADNYYALSSSIEDDESSSSVKENSSSSIKQSSSSSAIRNGDGNDGSSSSVRQSSSSSKESSSSSAQFDYITTSMVLYFTLTHYEQIVCTMEGKGSKACDYSDADPRISFVISFIQSNGKTTTYSTIDKLGKNWFYRDNTGEWDGRKTFTVTVPAMTESIKVCPTVVDDDVIDDDVMSSNDCYSVSDIGLLDYHEVIYQSDYNNEYCDLDWEWYLS